MATIRGDDGVGYCVKGQEQESQGRKAGKTDFLCPHYPRLPNCGQHEAYLLLQRLHSGGDTHTARKESNVSLDGREWFLLLKYLTSKIRLCG